MQPADALRWLRNAGIIGVLVGLCACMRLPATSAVTIAPIPPGLARVWFYREDLPDVGQQRPYVRMNGAVVGISEDGGAFYRDVPPGDYYVTVDSYGVDINQFPHIVMAPGETVYLQVLGSKYWASGGATPWERPTFYVWVMPPNVGAPAVAALPFYPGGA
jgi:hypothetical protein